MKYSRYWKYFTIYIVISYALGYTLSAALNNIDALLAIAAIDSLGVLLYINIRRGKFIKKNPSKQDRHEYRSIQRQYWIFFWISSVLLILTALIIA